MKKLLRALIVICVVSFTGFWVTKGLFGTRDYNPHYTGGYVSGFDGATTIFSELVTCNDSWEIVNEFPNINIHTAGATTIIEQNDSDRIHVNAEVPDGRKLYIGADYIESTGELTIEVRPENITFADVVEEFGKVLWSDDVFKFPEGVTVTISFPHTIYEELNIKHGSGKLYVDEIYSNNNNIEIGSGTFEMQRAEQFTSHSFSVDLGSGKATIKNMRSDNFGIDIGSGSFAFTGISGTGSVEMGSGKGSLVLANDCQDIDLDMGSGSLDIYIEESGADISADIGSGSLNIDAYGTKDKLKDDSDEDVVVGSGKTEIDIEMGSGSVYILEAANAPALVIDIPRTQNPAVSSSCVEGEHSSNHEVAHSSMPDASGEVAPLESDVTVGTETE